VRNLCAHHSRVWNRDFTFVLKIPRHRPAAVLSSLNPVAPRKLYNTLVLLAYILDTVSPGHHWKQRLLELLRVHSVSESDMGFPHGWRQRAIWK
jgi:abortive infection bacteriophage resistance protein